MSLYHWRCAFCGWTQHYLVASCRKCGRNGNADGRWTVIRK